MALSQEQHTLWGNTCKVCRKAEQIAEGRAIDDGKFKARLVCKDLKVINKLPIEQTYSGVPGLNGFRLLISAYGSSDKFSRISTTDFDTAFLQSDDYPDGERLRKYKNPRDGQWQYIWSAMRRPQHIAAG